MRARAEGSADVMHARNVYKFGSVVVRIVAENQRLREHSIYKKQQHKERTRRKHYKTMTDCVTGYILTDAAELFGLEKPQCRKQCTLFEAFERLSHNDVKEWLSKKVPMNQTLWNHGKKMPHGKGYNLKHKSTSVKLMYCWANAAYERKRITEEQLKKIVEKLPVLDVELQSPSYIPGSAPLVQAPATLALPTPLPPPVQPPTFSALPTPLLPPVQDLFAKYRGTLTFIDVEEKVHDVATMEAAYTSINMLSREAIFYGKTYNIENQIDACFERTLDMFAMYAKDSRAMITESVTSQTSFGPNW